VHISEVYFFSYNVFILMGVNIRKHNKRHKVLQSAMSSNIVLVGLVFIVALLGNATWNVYRTYAEARMREMRAREDLAVLIARAASLESDINRLNTDMGREEELRERFGVGRPGEQMIVVTNPEIDVKSAPISRDSWVSSWWKGLFKKY